MNRLRTGGALAAAGFACLALFAADAVAQTRKPWVDPPKTLAPPAPAAPAPTPAEAPAASPAPPAAAAPPEAAAPEAARPARRAAAPAPARRAKAVEAAPRRPRIAERPRALAPRPDRAEERRARLARDGLREGLEVMMLRTVTLPNGETVEVLEDPDPATMRRILRGRPVQ